MKVYKITFNEYTNALRDTISNKTADNYISVNKDGSLYVICEQVKQLQEFDNYGKGIKEVECLGGGIVLNSKTQKEV